MYKQQLSTAGQQRSRLAARRPGVRLRVGLLVIALVLATNAAAQTALHPLPLCKGSVRQCPEAIAKAPQAFLKRAWASVWVYGDLKNFGEAYEGCDARELHKFLASKTFLSYGIYGETEKQKYTDDGYTPSRPDAQCQYIEQYYKIYMLRRIRWEGLNWPFWWRLESAFTVHIDGDNLLVSLERHSERPFSILRL